MKKTIKTLSILSLALTLSNCAYNYKPPIGESKSAKATTNKSINNIFRSAQRSLTLDGYQISYANKQDGIISTGFKDLRLTPSKANCGSTMGLDYLKDNRTKTEVSFNVLIDKNNIEVRSTIKGEYKPGDLMGAQGITLTCISKGVLERGLINKIK